MMFICIRFFTHIITPTLQKNSFRVYIFGRVVFIVITLKVCIIVFQMDIRTKSGDTLLAKQQNKWMDKLKAKQQIKNSVSLLYKK